MQRLVLALTLLCGAFSVARADSTVGNLSAASTLGGTETVYCVQTTDAKCTMTQIKTWTSSSPTLVTPVIGVATGTSLAATTDISARDFIGTGTPPTLSGTCAVVGGTQLGGNTIGSFAVPAGDCAAATTVILTFAKTATTGWACTAQDHTTDASQWHQTGAASTTTATLTVRTATAVAADLVTFACFAY